MVRPADRWGGAVGAGSLQVDASRGTSGRQRHRKNGRLTSGRKSEPRASSTFIILQEQLVESRQQMPRRPPPINPPTSRQPGSPPSPPTGGGTHGKGEGGTDKWG